MPASAALIDTYQQAESLLISGELKQAANLCQEILAADPEFAYGHHLMAALLRTTGNLEKALDFERMALSREPGVPAFHMQLGQICFARGEWEGAAEAFGRAHLLEPENPFHLMLLADARAQQGRFAEALDLFSRARAASDIPDIDEHEALCLALQGRSAEAETLFDKFIARLPGYFLGYVHKGKLLMEKKRDRDAEACFSKALALNPSAHEALHGLALLAERRGQFDAAIKYAMQTVRLNPGGPASHALLGGLLLAQRQCAAAEQVLRQAHALNSGDAYVMEMLVMSLLGQDKKDEALQLVAQALAAQPGNAVLRHRHLALSGGNPAAAPKEYIVKLFDGGADRYDYQSQQTLAGRVPAHIADAVRGLQKSKDAAPLRLLDLGCGTGLAGEALKEMTAARVGVDLSERMLEKARARQLYDALHIADFTDFMNGCRERFDLVVAADALAWTGDLSPFLMAARGVLGLSGVLVFTVQRGQEGERFRLLASGRYTHAPRYVTQVAAQEGYTLLRQQDIALRTEKQRPVAGQLFVLKKSPMH